MLKKLLFMLPLIFTLEVFAVDLKIAILDSNAKNSLEKQIKIETKKLSFDKKVKFLTYFYKNKQEFFKVYKEIKSKKDIDIVISLDSLSSSFFLKEKNLLKKTIITSIFDLKEQNIDTSKKNQIIIDSSTYKKDIDFLKKHFPSFFVLKTANLSKLNKNKFVYLAQNLENKKDIYSYLYKKKIPFFDSTYNEKALFFNNKKSNIKISRAIAVILYEILNNEKYDTYTKIYMDSPVNFNEQVAKEFFYSIDYNLLLEVNRVFENKSKIKMLDLKEALNTALKNSIDIKVSNNKINLSNNTVLQAKSQYRPNLSLEANYISIDKDRAQFSNGLYSQNTFNTSLVLKQLLYSNEAYSNIDIQEFLKKSKKHETQALKEAVLYQVALTYLNILNIKSLEKINLNTKEFIKQNLQLAKNRYNIGISIKSDVYRWENELASININLSKIKKDLNNLKLDLSNLLQINSGKNINLQAYDINSTLFKILDKTPAKLIKNPKQLELFAKYLTSDFIKNHEQLKILDFLIKAKSKQVSMNKKSQFHPTLALQAKGTKIIDRQGAGEDFPRPWNDEEFEAVLNVKIPLYESGKITLKTQQSKIELQNLKYTRFNTKSKIQKNIYQTLEKISASYKSIKYSNIATSNAKKNFLLIQDQYSKSQANIVTLLDAQNSMIISQINQSRTTYEYLADIVSIYYNSGHIMAFIDDKKQNELEENFKKVLK